MVGWLEEWYAFDQASGNGGDSILAAVQAPINQFTNFDVFRLALCTAYA